MANQRLRGALGNSLAKGVIGKQNDREKTGKWG
jgi:hypothetical protein